jgi:hypothetical protein
MLRSFGLAGYKAFSEWTHVPASAITLIYGPNSAGKSSLIQSLLLLGQTVRLSPLNEAHLLTEGPLAALGAFAHVLPRHDRSIPVRFRLDFEGPLHLGPTALTFEFRSQQQDPRGVHYSTEIALKGEAFVFIRRSGNRSRPSQEARRGGSPTPDYFALSSDASVPAFIEAVSARVSPPSNRGRGDSRGRPHFLAAGLMPGRVLRVSSGPGMAIEDPYDPAHLRPYGPWTALSRTISDTYSRFLGGLAYLGPLRTSPGSFETATPSRLDVGVRGEQALHLIATDDNLRERVDNWFERLGLPYSLEVVRSIDPVLGEGPGGLVSLVLRDRRTQMPVSLNHVGVGVSQLLPLVVLAMASRERLILVEQPEIHVHPRMQSEVADMLLDSVAKYSNQFIVETHSEHLMLRIQKRIRQGRLAPEQVSVVYVNPLDSGSSEAIRLSLSEDGRFLDEWPQGFFEERLRELYG